MEVYILDVLLQRMEVIDRFESLIWTERWASWGDFEIVIHSTPSNRSLLKSGTLLAMNLSHRVMVIENIENATSAEGIRMLKVKGRSIEAIFINRGARVSMGSLTASPTWDISDTPGGVMRKIVHDICAPTGVDPIPILVESRHPDIPASTIVEIADTIGVKLEPQTVYDALTNLANTWNLGFRLLRAGDVAQLYFDVYAGTDRTVSQTLRPPVIFSPGLDNLQNTSELYTIENEKNVAYVIAPNGFLEVLADATMPEPTGLDRKVLLVKADDLDLAAGAPLNDAMLQRGKEALSEYRAYQAFDGEINQNSQYVYQRDFYLGDLVELRNEDGNGNHMRVVEQIFVSDREGDRAYPTLALNQFVNTGSWLSWEPSKKWIDFELDPIEWDELP